MLPRTRKTPLISLLVLLASGMLLAACNHDEVETHVIEGEPIEAGELSYKVQITRFLNGNRVDDRAYLEGAPPEAKGRDYLAVFIQIINEGDEPAELPEGIEIHDTRDNHYEPVEVDNPFALNFDATIEPGKQLPPLDSAAASGPIKGSMILFDLPENAGENRPLELIIPNESGGEVKEVKIELDL